MTFARRILTGLCGAIAFSGAAAAVLAPEYYEEARRSAPNHVQIKIDKVSSPRGGLGDCAVKGEVVRVFRGDFERDSKIAFNVSCYDYGAIPSGPTLWTDYDALSSAKYLEAFMLGGPTPKIALDQVEIILEPRDTPYCDRNSLYCESVVDSSARQEGCDAAGDVWNWLGLGADECR